MLRAKQMGFTIQELDEVDEGLLIDMSIESANDQTGGYARVASQTDFDSF